MTYLDLSKKDFIVSKLFLQILQIFQVTNQRLSFCNLLITTPPTHTHAPVKWTYCPQLQGTRDTDAKITNWTSSFHNKDITRYMPAAMHTHRHTDTHRHHFSGWFPCEIEQYSAGALILLLHLLRNKTSGNNSRMELKEATLGRRSATKHHCFIICRLLMKNMLINMKQAHRKNRNLDSVAAQLGSLT